MKDILIPPKSWLWLAVVTVLVTSCRGPIPGQGNQDTVDASATVVFVQDVKVVYRSFDELVNWADVIILGIPVAERDIINGARDIDDPTMPAQDFFGITQIYEVNVTSYLKGEGPETLFVGQWQGNIHQNIQELTSSAIQQARERAWQSGDFIPLSLNERYIFFLMAPRMVEVDFPEGSYSTIGNPWVFRINEADCVYPEDDYDLFRYWPPQTLESFLNDIANPPLYSADSGPYPAPVVHGTPCQVNPPVPPSPPSLPYPGI